MESNLPVRLRTTEQTAVVDPQPMSAGASPDEGAGKAIEGYLFERSEEFRKLFELCKEVKKSPVADAHYAKQRAEADSTSKMSDLKASSDPESQKTLKKLEKKAKGFYFLMQRIGVELHTTVNAFKVTKWGNTPANILDMCMAPGGFLHTALKVNRGATATAYSLPPDDDAGGHQVLLPPNNKVKLEFLDVTMLAADMGIDKIMEAHPDRDKFLPKHFEANRVFDIALCDGHVLRTHRRADYREESEIRRLLTTQLALSLEHLKAGGTIVVKLHSVKEPDTLEILYQFHQFSSVQLFKPTNGHKDRSSFYMIASDIKVDHAEAIKAVEEWKRTWKIATFGSEEEFKENIARNSAWAKQILDTFGEVLIQKSKAMWVTQFDALAKAPYVTGAQGRPQKRGQQPQKAD